ncbi:MAG: hypothetical protein ACOJUL_09290 [Candidatus Pollutiaquabacter aromativorans]|uniref:hypothetical protein n=1 Tax=Candidatus Pollutiaquabacter sp. TaxID=3416354 RepID=UPI003931C3C2|nr:hypothetical protein [Bacteroidota bacterium]
MRDYSPKVFEQLLLLVRDEDVEARAWLDREGYPELPHFWDALENVERSFKWLMENRFPELAATVDAMNGNDKAKVWLLSNRQRELAAFVDACNGQAGAVQWLIKAGEKGLLLIARELDERRKKRDKNFFWSLINLGNPFR